MPKVVIVYPVDPMGISAGGIATCIRDIIRCAPDDYEYSLIGITSDISTRPLNQWQKLNLGEKQFDFYPIIHIKSKPRIPAVLQFVIELYRQKIDFSSFDIIQFHRVEACIPLRNLPQPKFCFIHQNMEILNEKSSDLRWKYAPKLYFYLERWLIPAFRNVFCVHEKGVANYKSRFPQEKDKFLFVPTWVNTELFYFPDSIEREQLSRKLRDAYRITKNAKILLFVGRLDSQKNPGRLINAFSRTSANHDVHLLIVGSGVLAAQAKDEVDALGIGKKVSFIGAVDTERVSELMRGADLLLLPSDYEGMPRCVMEALGCGLPVVSTDVGEVRKVLSVGLNGEISQQKNTESFAIAIINCLDKLELYRGAPCLEAISEYTPQKVLSPVFKRISDSLN